MSDPERLDLKNELGLQIESEGEPHPVDLLANLIRAEAEARHPQDSPFLMNDTNLAGAHPVSIESHHSSGIAAAARALAAPSQSAESQDSAQRTLNAIRNALPLLQRLLPLLDGNVLASFAGALAPQPQLHQPAPKPVDPPTVEGGLAGLKAQQQELRSQILGQDSALKKMTDQLDHVREATDRNTLEQQDLIEELKTSGKRMNIVAFLAFALLAASIAMNVVLYLEIHRLLP
jgi:hypothetical protein